MKQRKLRYHYDREADVMYFYFHRSLRKAKTVELNARLSRLCCGLTR